MTTEQWQAVQRGIAIHDAMNPITRYDELRAAYAFSLYMGRMSEEEVHEEVMRRLAAEETP
jgi:hypothetical protein